MGSRRASPSPGHGLAGSASASRGGGADRGLKLPAASARRTDARACALQGADHAARSSANLATSRPASEKWPHAPGDVTGTSGEIYFGASGDDSNGIDTRVASRKFATVCLIQNVTRSPGLRDLERYIALGCWPRRGAAARLAGAKP
jgi:hypothetical protein